MTINLFKPILVGIIFLTFFFTVVKFNSITKADTAGQNVSWWNIQSIDTMKYSRDAAGAEMDNPNFDSQINTQVKNIKNSGANFVAIDTPYDTEFLPYLKKWVKSARDNQLHVWFRGNWSNWEGWFGRPKQMTFDQHIQQSTKFILDNPDLFENGDSFTACPECENGAQGDPRQTGNVQQYRDFLVNETTQTKNAFVSINKNVPTNWLSMNKDVADLVMDSETVKRIGGVIVIDHYVGDPHQLALDVNKLSNDRGAKILLGEFGAPIDDINGSFTDAQQAQWLNVALANLAKSPNLIGLNYWVNKGGNTQLWLDDDSPRPSVAILNSFFSPPSVYGKTTDNFGNLLDNVEISTNLKQTQSSNGDYRLGLLSDSQIQYSKAGYFPVTKNIKLGSNKNVNINVTLESTNKSIFEKIILFLRSLLGKN